MNNSRKNITGEYDPPFDFGKNRNPTAEDKEAARELEEKYKKMNAEKKTPK